MKNTTIGVCVCLLAFSLGCGPSREYSEKIIRVATEIAAIEKDYYPAITELGRVSVQIEELAKNQAPAMKPLAADLAVAQQLITGAFAACQKALDSVVVGRPKGMTQEKYLAVWEDSRDLFKQALEKTQAAVVKSHEILLAYSKMPAKAAGRK